MSCDGNGWFALDCPTVCELANEEISGDGGARASNSGRLKCRSCTRSVMRKRTEELVETI